MAKKRVENGAVADVVQSVNTALQKAQFITLPRLDLRRIKVRVVGDTELITHAWSQKAKQMMLDKQMMKPTAGRAAKDPEQDYLDSMYRMPDGGYGFPAIAFKNAAVTACTSLGRAITKVAARQAFHVDCEKVRIEGEPHMREDMVKIAMETADIRYRAGFMPWACELPITYNVRVLTDEQIVNLLNTAGFAVGVGEWRNERGGQYGLFHVA